MNKIFLLFVFFIFSLNSLAIKPYEATYALNVTSDIGSLKVGSADFKLELSDNNEFTFSSQSYTDSIWKKLYNYTRYEKSIGHIINNEVDGMLYDVVEIEKDEVTKNNKILINHSEGYAILNNENKWDTDSNNILDELNVYLAFSEDLKINADKDQFSYHVIDEKGIQLITFKYVETETITIEGVSFDSIKFLSPELKITINVSKQYDFIPLIINKNTSSNKFKLVLTQYTPS
jgi:hypothetical protein